MRRMILCALAAAMALVAGGAAAETISMDQVPAAAKAAAMYAAGGVKLTDVGLDLDGGQATYEFTGKNADGRQVEIDVLADGKIPRDPARDRPGRAAAGRAGCDQAVPAGLPAEVHRAQHPYRPSPSRSTTSWRALARMARRWMSRCTRAAVSSRSSRTWASEAKQGPVGRPALSPRRAGISRSWASNCA